MSSLQTHRRRFTVADVHQMLAAGVLHEDEPVELLTGDLVVMSPQNPRHAAVTERIRRILEQAFGPGFHTRTHSPLEVDAESLPEPDVGLFRGSVEDFLEHHPTGAEAEMVVEVAATSLGHDRAKAVLYAQAGIPVYWLADLSSNRLEVRSEPRDGKYTVVRTLRLEQRIAIPGTEVTLGVAEILG